MGKRKKSSRGPQGPRKVNATLLWRSRLQRHCDATRLPPSLQPRLTYLISQRDPLPKKFTCLFCNHEEAVTVSLDKKGGVGQLDCTVCRQNFQCAINCTLLNRGPLPPQLYVPYRMAYLLALQIYRKPLTCTGSGLMLPVTSTRPVPTRVLFPTI